MAKYPYRLVDVFTNTPLAGNQLAVFTSSEQIPEHLLQPIAKEMNLSETVFLFPPDDGGDRRVRIFTTDVELPFAGHPILGTACVLSHETLKTPGTAILETGKGSVSVSLTTERGCFTGWMDQPIPTILSWDRTSELLELLGVDHSVLPVELYDNGVPHLYVMFETITQVENYRPDFKALGSVLGGPRLNCFSGGNGTYITRMFSPFEKAMPEDPACGSAAGPLAAHVVRHGLERSETQIQLAQGAQVGRPSTLYATADIDDGNISRVQVGGHAVVVGEGRLTLPD